VLTIETVDGQKIEAEATYIHRERELTNSSIEVGNIKVSWYVFIGSEKNDKLLTCLLIISHIN
jgi:hypothetical protein